MTCDYQGHASITDNILVLYCHYLYFPWHQLIIPSELRHPKPNTDKQSMGRYFGSVMINCRLKGCTNLPKRMPRQDI